jgi:rod shape determining protein RodA
MVSSRQMRGMDYTLVAVLILLGVFGCVAVSSATFGKVDPRIPNGAWVKQAAFDLIGLIAMFFAAYFDYRNLRKLRWWLYGITTFLLVVVFAMPRVNGAHSWIPLGVLSVQPSEFAKLTLIIAVASFMANVDEEEFPDYRLKKTWPIWAIFVVPFLLTLKEPALGQALVMFSITMTMYVVFAKKSHFWFLTAALAVIVIGVVVVIFNYEGQSTWFIENVLVKHHLLQEFQANRIVTWLNPNYDLANTGYNIHQAQIAVGSGQVFGEGFHNGIETRGAFVPNQWTDYIFTAIGEEFGFVGSSLLVFLFLVLVYRLVRIAGTARDTFGTYLIMGVVGMFGFQVFENIGMDMYMSPSTGITLPFISYGGSSLIANYLAAGLALSVAIRRRRLSFD